MVAVCVYVCVYSGSRLKHPFSIGECVAVVKNRLEKQTVAEYCGQIAKFNGRLLLMRSYNNRGVVLDSVV